MRLYPHIRRGAFPSRRRTGCAPTDEVGLNQGLRLLGGATVFHPPAFFWPTRDQWRCSMLIVCSLVTGRRQPCDGVVELTRLFG